MTKPLLEVRDLVVRYGSNGPFRTQLRPAVSGVSLSLAPGETLGVVGESGSGKSSLLRAILRLVPSESGAVLLDGQDWLALSPRELRHARQAIGVVAQNPFLSLSPRMTISEILAEPLLARGDRAGAAMQERSAQLLLRCGLPADFLPRRASALSGGQAQRVAIARALALDPRLLVLDEPTSALDISVQAQILNLLSDLKAESGLSMLFVTHNLKVVAHISDHLVVMRNGEVQEQGPTTELLTAPRHDYTRQLFGFGLRAQAVAV
jgi:ABC-type glutathione transport system ATPase component